MLSAKKSTYTGERREGRREGRRREDALPEFGKHSCLFLLACEGEGSSMNHPSHIKSTTKILPEREESFFHGS